MESLPKRYAQALYSLAAEKGQVEKYQEEAKKVYLSLKENPGMVHLLSSYFLTQEEKDKAIDNVYSSVKEEDIRTFLKIISKNGRAYTVLAFLREFDKECNEALGISAGIVYSTEALTAAQMAEIAEAISKKEGIKAELTNEIDKSLLGGLKIVMGDKVYDASLVAALANLKSSIIQGGK
ncbi:MAG: ATP synthase F1 subunit delta [Bacilli bacterium]|jgi:F-type H+-transporting ATPase subunit delta|nr:ATP synthase F1 subunit delta [Bacilli bacterium]